MVQAVSYVKDAFVSQGSGILDFEPELRRLRPDIFFVNQDGNVPAKRAICEELAVEYIVLKRKPYADLPRRSTTALRAPIIMEGRRVFDAQEARAMDWIYRAVGQGCI